MNAVLFQSLAGAVALIGITSSAWARLEPGFDLKYARQNATHVVVVDADGTVLESWRGDLAKGDQLPFKAGKEPIKIVIGSPSSRDPQVESVTANRRVLFLSRGKDGKTWSPVVSFPDPVERLATVWIDERGHCFAIFNSRILAAPGRIRSTWMRDV